MPLAHRHSLSRNWANLENTTGNESSHTCTLSTSSLPVSAITCPYSFDLGSSCSPYALS